VRSTKSNLKRNVIIGLIAGIAIIAGFMGSGKVFKIGKGKSQNLATLSA
jgi:hypothetical protein